MSVKSSFLLLVEIAINREYKSLHPSGCVADANTLNTLRSHTPDSLLYTFIPYDFLIYIYFNKRINP